MHRMSTSKMIELNAFQGNGNLYKNDINNSIKEEEKNSQRKFNSKINEKKIGQNNDEGKNNDTKKDFFLDKRLNFKRKFVPTSYFEEGIKQKIRRIENLYNIWNDYSVYLNTNIYPNKNMNKNNFSNNMNFINNNSYQLKLNEKIGVKNKNNTIKKNRKRPSITKHNLSSSLSTLINNSKSHINNSTKNRRKLEVPQIIDNMVNYASKSIWEMKMISYSGKSGEGIKFLHDHKNLDNNNLISSWSKNKEIIGLKNHVLLMKNNIKTNLKSNNWNKKIMNNTSKKEIITYNIFNKTKNNFYSNKHQGAKTLHTEGRFFDFRGRNFINEKKINNYHLNNSNNSCFSSLNKENKNKQKKISNSISNKRRKTAFNNPIIPKLLRGPTEKNYKLRLKTEV